MIVLDNISQSIRNERIEKVHQYKDAVLASLSHNLKTPLNSILLYTSIHKKESKREKCKFVLNIVEKNIFLLLAMINDLLDYTNINMQYE